MGAIAEPAVAMMEAQPAAVMAVQRAAVVSVQPAAIESQTLPLGRPLGHAGRMKNEEFENL